MLVAVQLASLKQPFKQALHTAARLGARAVEIDARDELQPAEMTGTALRQVRKMLDDLNLRVASVRFQTRRGYDVDEQLDRRVEATKAAMRMAWSLGAAVVSNSVGRIEPPPPGGPAANSTAADDKAADQRAAARWNLLVEVLSDLGRHGDRVGTRLAARTGGEDADTLAALLDALPPGAIGVDLDPGGLIVNGFSPLEMVRRLGGQVIHVHARDAVRDLALGRGLEVPLGRGMADFPALLGELEQHEYRGYLTVDRHAADDPVGEAADAVRHLEALLYG